MANILLADDDISTRQFLAGALTKAGHTVKACSDGLAAISAFEVREADFDLLLTDIVMPGIDGIELSTRIIAQCPNVKVVFITGFAAMAMEPREGAVTPAKIISKPFHLGNLTKEIEEILKA